VYGEAVLRRYISRIFAGVVLPPVMGREWWSLAARVRDNSPLVPELLESRRDFKK